MSSQLFAATQSFGHLEVFRCAQCNGSWIQPPSSSSHSPPAAGDEKTAGIAARADHEQANTRDELEKRLQELEIKLAYQDDLVETLNQVVIDLRGEIATLGRSVQTIHQQVSESLPEDAPAHDPPPHY